MARGMKCLMVVFYYAGINAPSSKRMYTGIKAPSSNRMYTGIKALSFNKLSCPKG